MIIKQVSLVNIINAAQFYVRQPISRLSDIVTKHSYAVDI